MAGRFGGVGWFSLRPSGRVDQGGLCAIEKFDAVGVCAAGTHEHPNAFAVLGIDSSMMLIPNVSDPLDKLVAVNFTPNIDLGRGYKILYYSDHILILTSERVLCIQQPVSEILRKSGAVALSCTGFEVEAVDLTLTSKGDLLILLVDCINRIPFESLLPGRTREVPFSSAAVAPIISTCNVASSWTANSAPITFTAN